MRVPHVLSLLRRLELHQYAPAFEKCGIDGYACDLLDDELLEKQLGVLSREHRGRFLQWVEQMQTQQTEANQPNVDA